MSWRDRWTPAIGQVTGGVRPWEMDDLYPHELAAAEAAAADAAIGEDGGE